MSIRGASPMLNTLANSRGDGGTPHPGRTCERRTNTVLTGRFGFHEGNRAPFAFPLYILCGCRLCGARAKG